MNKTAKDENVEADSDSKQATRSERFSTEEVLNFEIYGSNDGPSLAVMRNLSKSGAFFEVGDAATKPYKGQFVRATVNLDSIGKARIFNGEVMWVSEVGFGIAFMRKEELVQKIIAKVAA